jgi:O-antigen/teichoic acid export membrane protein
LLVGASQWAPLVAVASTFALLSGWERILDGLQNAARARAVVAWHQAFRQWLRPLAAVALIGSFGSTSSVALAGFALASACLLFSQVVFFRRRLDIGGAADSGKDKATPGGLERRLVRYAAPFAVWGIFTWLQLSADRWALQLLTNVETVGLYAVLFQIGVSPVHLLGSVLSQLLGPIVFSVAGDGTDSVRVAAAFRLTLLIVLGMLGVIALMVLGASLLHAQVFQFLAGPSFQSISSLLPLAVLAGGFFNVGQLLCLLPLAAGNSRALLAPKIGTALAVVPLYLVGAILQGVQGVLIAGVCFGVSYSVWTAIVGLRVVRRAAFTT